MTSPFLANHRDCCRHCVPSAAWSDAVVAAVAVSYRSLLFCVCVGKRRAWKVVHYLGRDGRNSIRGSSQSFPAPFIDLTFFLISCITGCQDFSSHVIANKSFYNNASTVQYPKIITGYSQLSYQKLLQTWIFYLSTSDAAWITSDLQKSLGDSLFCACVLCMLAENA